MKGLLRPILSPFIFYDIIIFMKNYCITKNICLKCALFLHFAALILTVISLFADILFKLDIFALSFYGLFLIFLGAMFFLLSPFEIIFCFLAKKIIQKINSENKTYFALFIVIFLTNIIFICIE